MSDERLSADIDRIDYSILHVLNTADEPLWKKAIFDRVTEDSKKLPMDAAISVQTIGRRVEKLLGDGLIESRIVEPTDLGRDLIIAYTITDAGTYVLDAKQDSLMRNVVKQRMFPNDDGTDMEADALRELVRHRFDLDESDAERLDAYGKDELAAFLTLRYAQEAAVDILNDGDIDRFDDVLSKNSDISTALGIQ